MWTSFKLPIIIIMIRRTLAFYSFHFNRSFERLGPWCNRNDLLPILIKKLGITSLTTKHRPNSFLVPIVLSYLSSPQNLVALVASNSILSPISMTLRTMTPIDKPLVPHFPRSSRSSISMCV